MSAAARHVRRRGRHLRARVTGPAAAKRRHGLLAPWTAHVGPDSPFAGRISWHLVTFALAAAAAQDDEAAHGAIERALDLAAPELVRRPFVEERARLRPLLERHGAGATKHGAFVRDLLEREVQWSAQQPPTRSCANR